MKTDRVNFRVTAKERKRLEQILRLSNCGSLTQVVARALGVYEALLEVETSGGKIIVRPKDGDEETIRLLF